VRRALPVIVLLGLAAPARAQSDADGNPPPLTPSLGDNYDTYSKAWNGLSTFARVVDGLGMDLEVDQSVEWSDLGDTDILLLLYPTRRVDPTKVSSFVNAGGNVIVADDFGDSADAMNRLGLVRADIGTPRAREYYKGLMWAPIAQVRKKDDITEGVDQVVTNHPAVLTDIHGADALVGFEDGSAVIAAGERGTGHFVVVSDPSIFINRMLQFPGNLTVTVNMLRAMSRNGRATRVVLVLGDVPMYGDPRSYIDDGNASKFDRRIHDLNEWLRGRNDWLLTMPAMKVLGGVLATLLVLGAVLTLPGWRKNQADGRWLRIERPARLDDIERAVDAADAGGDNFVIAATVLRDLVQLGLQRVTGVSDPLFTLGEGELVEKLTAERGPKAGAALARVHRRLRALPSRSQAAAPWSGAHLARREFERLHDDAMELYQWLEPRRGTKS
jgi:hypothetical protein